ncbi:mitochondrial inner membrane protease ATP23 homolog isoform X4 [Sus scrofa]|uniref:Mitochondrial inner membrane protease ATP23 n=1 Tax=Sus scrofa TaxID=9823 RepID=A0A8D1QZD3_PIG|nr:mitochondrial inner membrane protease ATP23 homolog isoform X4 [Sus scrofa]
MLQILRVRGRLGWMRSESGVVYGPSLGLLLCPQLGRPGSFGSASIFTSWHRLNPYVKLLLDAMKHSGCAVSKERHFSCEDCNGNVSGGFDASVSQIVLCQNNIRNQAHMNRVVTHELIHAFDHCRAHVDWFTNIRHLACSEVRAANLSGDCSLLNEIFRLHFGLKQHHQTCVRDRAILSILAVRNISREVAQKAVDEVFESCFNDHEPFGRIPHNQTYARYAHRDFQNRDRYYSNI